MSGHGRYKTQRDSRERIAELKAKIARLKDDIRQLEYERAQAGKRILELERES